jgi:hypothetical protein
VTFDEALPIVRELVADLSDGERLRLLAFANAARYAQVVDYRMGARRGSGDGPVGKVEQKRLTVAAGKFW